MYVCVCRERERDITSKGEGVMRVMGGGEWLSDQRTGESCRGEIVEREAMGVWGRTEGEDKKKLGFIKERRAYWGFDEVLFGFKREIK